MWWSRESAAGDVPRPPGRAARAVAWLVVAGALAACGFRPLYGTPEYGVVPELAAIKVNPIDNRVGQQLRNMLYDRLTPMGQPKRPRYTLQVQVYTVKHNLGIQEDETVTRANLVIRAEYVLVAVGTGHELARGVSRSTTSYDLVESDFATLVAEADAERRALTVIRDDITAQISFYFTRARGKAS